MKCPDNARFPLFPLLIWIHKTKRASRLPHSYLPYFLTFLTLLSPNHAFYSNDFVFLVSSLSFVNISFPFSVVLEMSVMGSWAAALLCHPANTQIRAHYQPDFSDDHFSLVLWLLMRGPGRNEEILLPFGQWVQAKGLRTSPIKNG